MTFDLNKIKEGQFNVWGSELLNETVEYLVNGLDDKAKHEVTWINVLENGIKNVETDQTTELNKLILDTINSGGGVLYFPAGVYRGNIFINEADISIPIEKKKKWIKLKIVGDFGKTKFYSDTGSILKIAGELADHETRTSIAEFSMQDIIIDGGGKNVVGIELIATQHMYFDTVRVEDCGYHGIKMSDSWDTSWKALDMTNCGFASTGSSQSNYAAIYMEKVVDNSNTHKFVNLRIENCPIMLWSNGYNRHNYFTNCKFEKSTANNFEVRPIHIVDALEMNFENCYFTNRVVGETGPIEVDSNFFYISDSGIVSQGENFIRRYPQTIKFSNCDFTCATDFSTRWGTFKNTKFISCTFSQSEGLASYPFQLNGNVEMLETQINTVNGEKVFHLKGPNNIVDVSLNVTPSGNSSFRFGYSTSSDGQTNSPLKNNIIRYHSISDAISSSNLLSFDSNTVYTNSNSLLRLWNNKVIDTKQNILTLTGTGIPFVKNGSRVISLPDVITLSDINYVQNEQVFTIIPTNAMTVTYDETRIITKTKTDVNVLAGTSITFMVINGVLYEI